MREAKVCTGCGLEKPASEYYLQKRRLKDGTTKHYLRSKCKSCEHARIKDLKERRPHLKVWKPKTQADRKKLRRYQREYWRMTRGQGMFVWKKYEKELREGAHRTRVKVDSRLLVQWFDEHPQTYSSLPVDMKRAVLRAKEQGWITFHVVDQLMTAADAVDQMFAVLPDELEAV